MMKKNNSPFDHKMVDLGSELFLSYIMISNLTMYNNCHWAMMLRYRFSYYGVIKMAYDCSSYKKKHEKK